MSIKTIECYFFVHITFRWIFVGKTFLHSPLEKPFLIPNLIPSVKSIARSERDVSCVRNSIIHNYTRTWIFLCPKIHFHTRNLEYQRRRTPWQCSFSTRRNSTSPPIRRKSPCHSSRKLEYFNDAIQPQKGSSKQSKPYRYIVISNQLILT